MTALHLYGMQGKKPLERTKIALNTILRPHPNDRADGRGRLFYTFLIG